MLLDYKDQFIYNSSDNNNSTEDNKAIKFIMILKKFY